MPDNVEEKTSDLVWGAEAIGDEISRTAAQVYYLLSIGALDGAVAKLGHKTLVGSRRELSRLPFRPSSPARKINL
jgi:hypothetical protein